MHRDIARHLTYLFIYTVPHAEIQYYKVRIIAYITVVLRVRWQQYHLLKLTTTYLLIYKATARTIQKTQI